LDAVPVLNVELFAGLFRHQRTELEHLLGTPGHRALLWQMGCGKTLMPARLALTCDAGRQSLYLCPHSVKTQSRRELIRWSQPGIRIQILEGGRAVIDRTAHWVIANHDLLIIPQVFAQLIAQRWSILTVDESHVLRNASAKRTRAVFGRGGLADRADRVLCLTGTPIISSAIDLYPMLNRLFPRAIAVPNGNGGLRRMTLAEFSERYCTFRTLKVNGRAIQTINGSRNTGELRARIAPYVSRVRLRDVIDLPPLRVTEYALAVTTTPELTTALQELPPSLLEEIQVADGDALFALLRRHTQVLATLRRLIGIAKVPAAVDYLTERLAGGVDRIAVYFHHRTVADLLQTQLQRAGVTVGVIRGDTPTNTRTALIDFFDAGELSVLALQLQSGSLGLNLQCAAHAAFIEVDWTAATNEQAIARLYRAGQTRSVTVDLLMIPDSLDEHVVATARRKAAIAAALIEQQPQQKE
jgi:SNF2 family DNA or RNA helicase